MSGGGLDPIERIFNVVEQRQNFVSFMQEVRSAVRDPDREDVNGLPITRPVTTGAPRQWLRLRMEMDSSAVVLWVRTDNLYVQGFEQPQRGAARWEFGRTGKEEKDQGKNKRAKKKSGEGPSQQCLIPRSQLLGFGGGYTDLGGIQQGSRIGWRELESSIHGLARYQGSSSTGAVRTWLRTIIVSVSESLRLNDVCQEVGRLLRECSDGALDHRMCLLINAWGKMSKAVIDWANDPDGDDAARYRHMDEFCSSSEEACRIVCILNHGPAVQRRQKREARARAVDDVPEGLTFVEIFSVAVDDDSSSSRRRSLYGHIAVDDGLSSVVLFQRDWSSTQLVSPGEPVELTGPSRALWCNGEVTMHVDLTSVSDVPDMTPDEEVGSGQLVWNTYDTSEVVYNKVEEYVFEGQSGAVTARCAVITNAVVATVVFESIGQGEKELYGTLSAATATFGPADKVTLFDREWEDAVSVRAGEGIPLLRSVAVVPLDSHLIVSTDLWARATVPDMTPDDRFVEGDAVFYSRTTGKEERVIADLVVLVTWSSN